MAQDYTVNVKLTGADKVKQEADAMTKSLGEAGEAGNMAFSQLDGILGGVPSKMSGAFGGVKKLAGGFKSLRAAIISTGIGALVVALTSLVTFFSKTQRGAEILEKATAGLGAAFGIITDKVSFVGEGIFNAFNNPHQALKALYDGIVQLATYIGTAIKTYFAPLRITLLKIKEGALQAAIATKEFFGGDATALRKELDETKKDFDDLLTEIKTDVQTLAAPFVAAAEGVATFATEVAAAVEQGTKLADASISLRKAQRDLRVEMAESRRDIKAYNLIAEDTTKGFDERIEAAQKAIDIERGLMAERQRQAEEELRIHNEKMAMSESTEEDFEKQAELQARVFELQTESLEMQTTLNNKLNTLEQQRTATIEAEANKRLEAQRKADEEATKISLEEQKRREELEKRHQDAIASLKESAIAGTFSVLNNLSQAFEKDTEEGQKKAFKRNKAISIAETLVSTYQAAQKAYASQLAIPTPDAPIRAQVAAGIAVAAGLAKVAAIKSQQFSGGGGGGAAAGGGAIGGGGVQSVGVDVGSLVPTTGETTPEPVRAYVVSNEISNKQALDRELQIQTTL